jgi:ubiquinone biosynthesis protein COQ9
MSHKNIKDFFAKDTNSFDAKEKCLNILKEIVPFEGWNNRVLEEASEKLGHEKAYYKLIFPRGVDDAVEFYEDYANAEMLYNLDKKDKPQSITAQVEQALNARIFEGSFSKLFLRKTADYYLSPKNACSSIKAAWELASQIWYYAGDKATDFNYYTKRSLLSGIYISSIAYYLNDDSELNHKTKEFISKSLAKIVHFAKISNRIKMSLPTLSDIPILRMFL